MAKMWLQFSHGVIFIFRRICYFEHPTSRNILDVFVCFEE